MAGHEIEVKLQCDLAALERAQISLELIHPRHFEQNWLFDTPSGEVGSNYAVLRVRAVDGAGTLTYKAPPLAADAKSQFKKRIELETAVGDPHQLIAILTRLGYRKWFGYEKYRTVYKATVPGGGELSAMIDETPLGSFIELEGAEEAILEATRMLEITPDQYILVSYLELQADRCAAQGRPLEDLVFS